MPDTVVLIAQGVVNAKLVNAPEDVRLLVNEALSYEVEGAQYIRACTGFSGSSSLFEWEHDRFPAGFVPMIVQKLKKAGYRPVIKRRPAPPALGPERPVVDDLGYSEEYDYQPGTIDRLVARERMIARVATGGGKSRIAKIGYKRIGRMTLFVTTRKSLAYQMADAVKEDLGEEVGFLGDGQWNVVNGFNCAIVDTLGARVRKLTLADVVGQIVEGLEKELMEKLRQQAKIQKLPHTDDGIARARGDKRERLDKLYAALKQDQDQQWPLARIETLARSRLEEHNIRRQATLEVLQRVEFVIVEEAHEVSSNTFYDVMCACKNAHYRLALTATPFMKDSAEANMRLMAATGPIGMVVSEKELIDRGVLARPYFVFQSVERPEDIARGTPFQKAYDRGLVNHKARNKAIIQHVLQARDYGLNAMVLVSRTAHGDFLERAFKKLGLKAAFIKGDDKQDVRKRWLTALGDKSVDVLIGTTILDVGVDVPAVGLVVLAGGGKAEVSHRQRIGRGLRRKKTGPNVCLVVDFTDQYNKHLASHANQRMQIVKDTPGFAEGIIKGERFPFEQLGFEKTDRRKTA